MGLSCRKHCSNEMTIIACPATHAAHEPKTVLLDMDCCWVRLLAIKKSALQEERNSRAEETASLRGTISALEARVTTAQAAISAAEDARLQASSDCSRLRNDLERTTSQRDEAQASAATAQAELTRLNAWSENQSLAGFHTIHPLPVAHHWPVLNLCGHCN